MKKEKHIAISRECFDLTLWCIRALREQHIKIMLEGEDSKEDRVTKKADVAEKMLLRALSKNKAKIKTPTDNPRR